MFCDAGIQHGWCDDGVTFNGDVVAPPVQIDDTAVPPRPPPIKDLDYYARLVPNADKPKGDPRFHALLKQIGELHDQKQADYGRDQDPFANVRASEEWGVTPWIGALIRATDKVRRLQTYANKGSLINEGVEDSLMDLAVYALISLILFREAQE